MKSFSLCWSYKDEHEIGTAFLDACVSVHWTVWECPQAPDHDPSILAKGWRGPWRAFGMCQRGSPNTSQAQSRHKCGPGFMPIWQFAYSHPASKQVPSIEVARDEPVALIAQEIFQVHLIFECRQYLPGKKKKKKSILHLQLLSLQADGNFGSRFAGCKSLQGALIQKSMCLCALLNHRPHR